MELQIMHSITLRDYLRIIFSHKLLFLILPLAVVIPLYFSLELRTPYYEASVKMYIKAMKETEADYYKTIRAISLGEEHSELVNSNVVIERVVKAMKLYERPIDYEKRNASRIKKVLIDRRIKKLKQTIDIMSEKEKETFLYNNAVSSLKSSVNATPLGASNFFFISVRDFDPTIAQYIANSVSRSYVMFDLEQQIEELKLKYGEKHSTVMQLQDYITEMQATLDGNIISDLDAIGPASIKIIAQAKNSIPRGVVNKNTLLILSIFASLVIAVIFSFVFEMFNQTIRSPKDIELFLHIPFLGSIPKKKKMEKLLITDANPGDTAYKQSIQLRSEKLAILIRDNNWKTLLLTAIEHSKETSAIIANIAINMSRNSEYNVLIIDADLRNALISEIFNVSNNPGVADVLQGKSMFIDVIQELGSNLNILPAGESVLNPMTLLVSPKMTDLLKTAGDNYDMVFINTPDIKIFNDVVVVSSIADCTALILNENELKRQVIANAIAPLKQKNINLIGAFLNNRKYVIPDIIYRWA